MLIARLKAEESVQLMVIISDVIAVLLESLAIF